MKATLDETEWIEAHGMGSCVEWDSGPFKPILNGSAGNAYARPMLFFWARFRMVSTLRIEAVYMFRCLLFTASFHIFRAQLQTVLSFMSSLSLFLFSPSLSLFPPLFPLCFSLLFFFFAFLRSFLYLSPRERLSVTNQFSTDLSRLIEAQQDSQVVSVCQE